MDSEKIKFSSLQVYVHVYLSSLHSYMPPLCGWMKIISTPEHEINHLQEQVRVLERFYTFPFLLKSHGEIGADAIIALFFLFFHLCHNLPFLN